MTNLAAEYNKLPYADFEKVSINDIVGKKISIQEYDWAEGKYGSFAGILFVEDAGSEMKVFYTGSSPIVDIVSKAHRDEKLPGEAVIRKATSEKGNEYYYLAEE